MARAHFRIDPKKLPLCLDRRYDIYSNVIGDQIRDAAIAVFVSQNKPGNEWRTSETTPPKYLASFRIQHFKATHKTYVINSDPAWHLVEFGAHPGGDPDTFVLKYKPLTRGLLLVASRHSGR